METRHLAEIATANETSKNVFEVMSNRERARRETDLRRLQRTLLEAGKKVVDDEFINIFSKLQDAGIGTLVIGRGGRFTRFKWYYNMREVAKVALAKQKASRLSKIDPAPKEAAQDVKNVVNQIILTDAQLQELIRGVLAQAKNASK